MVEMTNRIYPAGLKKSCLASLVGLILAQSTFALESLSDEYLADTTGEGIALLPENFKMVFQGANDLSTASSYNRGVANPQQYDTGFIRIIPVGENYSKYTDALRFDELPIFCRLVQHPFVIHTFRNKSPKSPVPEVRLRG